VVSGAKSIVGDGVRHRYPLTLVWFEKAR